MSTFHLYAMSIFNILVLFLNKALKSIILERVFGINSSMSYLTILLSIIFLAFNAPHLSKHILCHCTLEVLTDVRCTVI